MVYRPEIDGLRALAVIPVILFHAGFAWFGGGFVGVDVFFVISGYLITSILISDIENKEFSIADFYQRRARRILPLLFLVVFLTLPFTFLYMTEREVEEFSKVLFSVPLFLSNFLFWKESDYFATATEESPLIHTWSLAVEEQFYLIFPLLLIVLWKKNKKTTTVVLFIIAVISMYAADWMSSVDVSANFYLLPFRIWELLFGALIAINLTGKEFRESNILSSLGLFLIIFSILFFDKGTPWPSFYTLTTVIGTAFIINYCNNKTYTGLILGSKPFVSIGLISYGAYLIHQPVLAFMRIKNPEDLTLLSLAFALVSTFVLSYFLWKYFETPFRKNLSNRFVNFSLLISAILILLAGHFYQSTDGKINPYHSKPEFIKWDSLGDRPSNQCTLEQFKYFSACVSGDKDSKKNIILYGDSHSDAISYVLSEKSKEFGYKLWHVSIDGCESIPYFREDKNIKVKDCDIRFDSLIEFISTLNGKLIVANRWTMKLYPIEGFNIDFPYKNSEGFKEKIHYREYDVYKNNEFKRDYQSKKDALVKFIHKLSKASKDIILVYPIPETAIDIYKFNWRYWNAFKKPIEEISFPYDDYKNRNRVVLDIFNGLNTDNLVRVRPEKVFCDKESYRCYMQRNSIPLYLDDDHLNDAGSSLLLDEFFHKNLFSN